MSDEDRKRLSMTPPPYPIQDWESAWNSIVKMSTAVNRIAHVAESIPKIHEDAHVARVESTRAAAMAEALGVRVEHLEEEVRKPHVCKQAETIDDIERSIREQAHDSALAGADISAVRERVTQATEAIGDVHDKLREQAKRRATWVMWVGGVLIAFLGAVAGAIWYVAQMAKTLEIEAEQRQRDTAQIIERLNFPHRALSPAQRDKTKEVKVDGSR